MILFVDQNATSDGRDAAFQSSAVAITLLLVLGPWAWRLAAERDAERIAPHPLRGARRDGRAHPRLRAADPRARPARGRRPAACRRPRAPAGTGAARMALPDARTEGATLGAAIDVGGGRGRGASRRPGRARPHRRRAARRPGRGARARRARGDGERRRALRRRRGIRLRRRRRRRDRGLRPRPRRRLRPGRPAAGFARGRRVDPRPHGARRRHGDARSSPGDGTEVELRLERQA